MNLVQTVARLAVGVMRDDLAPLYPDFINEALKEIQRRRSWNKMKTRANVTVLAQTKLIALPEDFKELTTSQSPIHTIDGDGVLVPCEVWTREKIFRRGARLLFTSLMVPPLTGTRRSIMPVYLTYDSGLWWLNIYDNTSENVTFSISYYAYQPDLVDDTDTNFLTNEYSQMVVNKAKAIAFASINDPATSDLEQLYELDFKQAAAQDAFQGVAGITIRM